MLLTLDDLNERETRLVGRAEALAATFAAVAPAADAGAADAAGADVSPEGVAALRASGLCGLTVPERLGGTGASLHEFALVQQVLGRGDASLGLIAAMNGHLLGGVGEGGGWPEALYAEVAGAAVARGALSNSLASEPELGSPSRGGLPRTRAERAPGGFRVSGRKTWGTGAAVLDFLVVSAAVTAPDGAGEVWRFVLPRETPGLRGVPGSWDGALALRASGAVDVVFEDAFVPDARALAPSPARGPHGPAWFWTAVAATYLGVGEAALFALVDYARGRAPTALGEPIATLPAVQARVGEIELDLAAAQALLHRATRAWVRAPERRAELLPALAGAKRACTNAAVRATDLALRTAGGAALTRALPLERLFRDARAGLAHPPDDDAALALIGRAHLDGERNLKKTAP